MRIVKNVKEYFMPLQHKVDDTWKNCNVYTKVDGVWKEVKNLYYKTVDGWKPIWKYSWKIGEWNPCTIDCEGGTVGTVDLTAMYSTGDRFAGDTYYRAPSFNGYARYWQLSGKSLVYPRNDHTLTGIVTKEKFTNYVHDCTVYGSGDNDAAGAVIAVFDNAGGGYGFEAGVLSLIAVREGGNDDYFTGNKRWAITFCQGNQRTVIATSGAALAAFGWQGRTTRIQVTRSGNVITCKCSEIGSNELLASTTITINLNNYPQLAWAKQALPYGYCCYSQVSTFTAKSNEISGIQTRAVECFRSDGVTKPDVFCEDLGTKPEAQKACSSAVCTTCKYVYEVSGDCTLNGTSNAYFVAKGDRWHFHWGSEMHVIDRSSSVLVYGNYTYYAGKLKGSCQSNKHNDLYEICRKLNT